MPIAPDPSLITKSSLIADNTGWLWLCEIEIGTSEVGRVALNDADVTWNGSTWYAYPWSVPDVPEDTDTSAKTFRVAFANVDQILTDRLRDGEILNRAITFHLVHASHLSVTEPLMRREAEILAATIEPATGRVTLTCGALNWLSGTLGRRFLRLRCRHEYGGAACGYVTTRPGALATCDRTLDGANGCTVHGDEEASVGLARLHPERFGGEPGIPRNNRG